MSAQLQYGGVCLMRIPNKVHTTIADWIETGLEDTCKECSCCNSYLQMLPASTTSLDMLMQCVTIEFYCQPLSSLKGVLPYSTVTKFI